MVIDKGFFSVVFNDIIVILNLNGIYDFWLLFLDNMKVLKRKKVEVDGKEFLLFSGDFMIDSKIILYILIDDNKGEFIVKKVKERKLFDEFFWEF